MELNQGFDVPNLGATPVPEAAGQSLWGKFDPKVTPAQDFTLASLQPVRQKLHDSLGSEHQSGRFETRFGPRPIEIRYHSQSLLRGGLSIRSAAVMHRKIRDLSAGACDLAHTTFFSSFGA